MGGRGRQRLRCVSRHSGQAARPGQNRRNRRQRGWRGGRQQEPGGRQVLLQPAELAQRPDTAEYAGHQWTWARFNPLHGRLHNKLDGIGRYDGRRPPVLQLEARWRRMVGVGQGHHNHSIWPGAGHPHFRSGRAGPVRQCGSHSRDPHLHHSDKFACHHGCLGHSRRNRSDRDVDLGTRCDLASGVRSHGELWLNHRAGR